MSKEPATWTIDDITTLENRKNTPGSSRKPPRRILRSISVVLTVPLNEMGIMGRKTTFLGPAGALKIVSP